MPVRLFELLVVHVTVVLESGSQQWTHLIAVLVVVFEHRRDSASYMVVASASDCSFTVWHRFVISRHADLCSQVMRCFNDKSGCGVSDPAYNWAHVKIADLSEHPS
jgi:hypothetical protein